MASKKKVKPTPAHLDWSLPEVDRLFAELDFVQAMSDKEKAVYAETSLGPGFEFPYDSWLNNHYDTIVEAGGRDRLYNKKF